MSGRKMKVIQLGHSSRQGKDTFADAFIESAEKAKKKILRIAYADELKNIIAKEMECTVGKVEWLKINEPDFVKHMEAVADRIKEEDPNYFVNIVKNKLLWADADNFDYAIITDLRFPEEWMQDALKIKIIRPGFEPKSKSDKMLEGSKWDIYVKNDFSKQHLASQADSIFKAIENGQIKIGQ